MIQGTGTAVPFPVWKEAVLQEVIPCCPGSKCTKVSTQALVTTAQGTVTLVQDRKQPEPRSAKSCCHRHRSTGPQMSLSSLYRGSLVHKTNMMVTCKVPAKEVRKPNLCL